MQFDLSEDDIKFVKKALNYVVLSLDGNKVDNSDLDDIDKCRVLAQCFYLMQMFDNPIEDNKKESAVESFNPWRDVFK
jgi:hypothetical protein